MIFIIDAYNVIHKIKRLERALDRGLRAGREALMSFCAEILVERRNISKFILVFDGRSEFHDLPGSSHSQIETIFSETGEDADERIIQVLENLEKTSHKCVVSDDNFVRNTARAHQARTFSVFEFETFCRIKNQTLTPPPTAQKNLDAQAADEITRAYRKELGL